MVFDEELCLEAYRFEGIAQAFPMHFHDYYVFGLVERGERRLICGGEEYSLSGGDILLLEPSDSHGCTQTDNETFDYRAFNITKEKMSELYEEITGETGLPHFSKKILKDAETADSFGKLHEMVLNGGASLEKEENLLILLSELINRSGKPFLERVSRYAAPIDRTCRFMDEHFSEHITLESLCRASGLSKSTLLRSFTEARGVTPYRYLQAVRIGKARELLEQGTKPLDAALMTGFSDQSHFTNSFGSFIGLSPTAYRKIFQNNKTNNVL